MSIQDRLDELHVVERPLLRQLEGLGWTTVSGADEDAASGRKTFCTLGRADYQQVLLPDRLRTALRALNLDEAGLPWLDDARLDAAIAHLERPTARDFIAINEELHDKITGGVYLPAPGGGRPRPVTFIDFERPEHNDFLAVSQFRVDPPGLIGDAGFIVPDIVLFVNGIPLVVIECKSPAVSDALGTAIDQLRRYANRRAPERNEGAERLFHTNHLLIPTSYYEARVGSISARPDDFLPWRDTSPLPMSAVAAELGKPGGAMLQPQEVLAAGLLRPARLLDAIRSFTVFTTTDDGIRVKIVPRYQQFRAVHAAIDRLRTGKTRAEDGLNDQRGGIIWHTQGSGKSLTMVFLLKKMRTLSELRRFKVVVITDRTDLEEQLSKTARLAGQVMRVATSTAGAREHLGRQEPDLVFVMIQKLQDRNAVAGEEIVFATESVALATLDGETVRSGKLVAKIGERPAFAVLNDSTDILVLIDEAHRSHTSNLHQNLLEALPNAARIGFTGTPIEESNKKKTREIFGTFIDRYLLRDAEADGAIVKILYEGRETVANVTDQQQLDALFDATFSAKSPDEREAIKNRYASRTAVLNAADPLRAKAADILRHYIGNILPNGFKAQLVAASRELAVRYVGELQAARDEVVAAIEGAADILKDIDQEAAEAAGGDVGFLRAALPHLERIRQLDFAAVISIDHNDLPHLKAWGGASETTDRIARFKKPLEQEPLAILVVKSKLLTGFDAKVEQAMYLDRAMAGAELLQAIARTNRTAGEKKRFGIVVDYYGVGQNLADALALYDAEDREDLDGGIARPEDLIPELRLAHDALVKLFADEEVVRGASLQAYVDACVDALRQPRLRADFAAKGKTFIGLFDTLMPRPEARAYAADAKLYAFIAKAASNLYRDKSLDIRGVAQRVQAILDAYIEAHGINPKIPPIEILDPEFAAQVAGKGSDRAKAAEMENALRFHISVGFDRDPARYRRLSERLEEILAAHRADWKRLADELFGFIDEERDREADHRADHGLDPRTQAPIFGLLRERLGDGDHDGVLVELTTDIADHIAQEMGVPGFWDNPPVAQELARRWIVDRLDQANLFSFAQLDAVAADCMGVARANRAAFAS